MVGRSFQDQIQGDSQVSIPRPKTGGTYKITKGGTLKQVRTPTGPAREGAMGRPDKAKLAEARRAESKAPAETKSDSKSGGQSGSGAGKE